MMNTGFLRPLMLMAFPLATMLQAADYTAWGQHKTITLNTSATGANVTGTVTNFPLLVRLGSTESAILAAANNGASIRFSKADNATPLPYQIERWTSTGAVIWVKVDTVYGNNATQTIRMHYSNAAATSESNGPAVFDTANGYRGVWHLQDSTGAKSTDATVLNTNATWVNSPVLVEGLIGQAVNINQPDGVDPTTAKYLRANYNVANNNFKISSATGLTLSVWVKRTASTGGNEQGILGRYNWGANARQAMIATNGSDQIRLFRSINGTNASGQETNFGNQTLVDGQWTHIVATVRNGSQILYVNGVQDVAQTTANIGSLDSIWANTSTLAFGHMAPDHGSTTANQAFNGVLDEARYTGAFRSADWIKLEYANQKAMNSLVDIGLPTAPGAPTGVTGVSGNGQVVVSWTAPASNGGSEITSYKAMAVADTTKNCLTITQTCTIAGLTNGTAYTFIVRATNAIGSGPNSVASTSVTPAPTVPGAPFSVTAAVVNSANGTVNVSWSAPATNGGSAITAYTVTGTPGGSCATTGALTCTVNGLTVGTLYSFTVKATNAVGQGPASVASNSITAATPILGDHRLVFADGFARDFIFRLAESDAASVSGLTMLVSDAFGRTVWSKSLTSSELRSGEVSWDGKTTAGKTVSAGLYVVRVKAISGGKTVEFRNSSISLKPGK